MKQFSVVLVMSILSFSSYGKEINKLVCQTAGDRRIVKIDLTNEHEPKATVNGEIIPYSGPDRDGFVEFDSDSLRVNILLSFHPRATRGVAQVSLADSDSVVMMWCRSED